jgi:histidine triad (HIT) family protein
MSSKDCVFCKIVSREIPARVLFEDDNFLAFSDVNPKAKIHILLIPKDHIPSLNQLDNGEILVKVKDVAKGERISDGYRVRIHTGKKGGQEVDHLHLHILAD